jgi:hypothetical protein
MFIDQILSISSKQRARFFLKVVKSSQRVREDVCMHAFVCVCMRVPQAFFDIQIANCVRFNVAGPCMYVR